MLGRAWSDTKILDLQHRLGMPLPHVMGHLEALFKGAYEHVPASGRLTSQDMQYLETWAMWAGDPGKFAAALVQAGLIVQNKRGCVLAHFKTSVPDFVRKRWARKHLAKARRRPPVRTTADNGAYQDKTRTDKKGEEEKDQDMPSTGAAAAASAPPASQAAAPLLVRPNGPKDQNGKDSSSVQGVCLALVERLRQALAQEPRVPALMLLVASGMNGVVARDLARKHAPDRVRQAAVYASRSARQNPAGLMRSILENPDWKLT